MKSSIDNYDFYFMKEALIEAQKAFACGEVPVGAVIVFKNKIIARAHNLVETKKDATAHAELLCIQKAATALKNWRLIDTTLYTTLEPCILCAGAIINSRIKKVIYGAPDIRQGAYGSFIDLQKTPHPIHNSIIENGLCAFESRELMINFFKRQREKNEKKN